MHPFGLRRYLGNTLNKISMLQRLFNRRWLCRYCFDTNVTGKYPSNRVTGKTLSIHNKTESSPGRFCSSRPPREHYFVSHWRSAILLCTPMGFSFEDMFDSLNKVCEVYSTRLRLAKLELLSWPVGASDQLVRESVILLGGWRWLGLPSSITWQHNPSRSRSVKHFFLRNHIFAFACRPPLVPQLWQTNSVCSCATSLYPGLRNKLYAWDNYKRPLISKNLQK
jgi:hypothetical protein